MINIDKGATKSSHTTTPTFGSYMRNKFVYVHTCKWVGSDWLLKILKTEYFLMINTVTLITVAIFMYK